MLAKKELSYVPVIGWMWYFLEIVFCKRKWEEDRKTVLQSLQNLQDYPENFWVGFSSFIKSVKVIAAARFHINPFGFGLMLLINGLFSWD